MNDKELNIDEIIRKCAVDKHNGIDTYLVSEASLSIAIESAIKKDYVPRVEYEELANAPISKGYIPKYKHIAELKAVREELQELGNTPISYGFIAKYKYDALQAEIKSWKETNMESVERIIELEEEIKAVREGRDEEECPKCVAMVTHTKAECIKEYPHLKSIASTAHKGIAALQAEIKALKEEDCVEFCQGIKDLQAEIKGLKAEEEKGLVEYKRIIGEREFAIDELQKWQKKYKELRERNGKLEEYYEGDGKCRKCDSPLMPPSCAECDFKERKVSVEEIGRVLVEHHMKRPFLHLALAIHKLIYGEE